MSNSAPRTIVFVLPALTAGGAERVLITLMNGLDRTKYSPALINVNGPGPMEALIAEDIPVYNLEQRVSTALPALYQKLKMLEPSIVVSTMAHMNFALLTLRPFFKQTRFIVREAITPSFLLDKYKKTGFLIKAAYRLLYPRASVVLSPAQIIIDEFAAIGVKTDNHKVLPNPVDSEKIRTTAQNLPARADPDTVHYICAGRLHYQKGYDQLIDALPALPGRWHLTILGDGAEKEHLQKQIAVRGLEKQITLAGHAPEPWPHIAASDALLLPSRWEGLPNIVLESLACGTPVIATAQAGGIQEIAVKTPPKALTFAETMPAFIDAMRKVKPQPVQTPRLSILPQDYEKGSVLKSFTKLLEGVT